ncbi:MAG: SRPBCC family protein [Actinobacteria bacterium]|nr:SRPBCC family protein [Actinomycetota bacterium]
MSKTIEQSVEVEVPVRTAYNQWTQFEEFPKFMEGIESVQQHDDTHLHWKAEIAGQTREWNAEIDEQTPDQRVAWHSTDGVHQAGVVTFHRLDDSKTKVMLQLEIDPDGFAEQAAAALGIITGRVKGDLGRFKEFIESRGAETGAWRGEVDQPKKTA